MNGTTAFLLGAVCGGLGFAAYDWIGWTVGMICAIAIITVEHVLDSNVEEERRNLKEVRK